MSLIDSVQQQLGPGEITQISQRLGISPGLAQTAISAAVPMIVGGMARHASQPDGASAVGRAIDAHQSAADDPASAISAAQPADVTAGPTTRLGDVELGVGITGRRDRFGAPAGKYTLHVLMNGQEVQTKDFTVK